MTAILLFLLAQTTDIIPRGDHLLTRIDGLAGFLAQHQDERGAIIDPLLDREHQYSTPCFAYGVGTLLSAGVRPDLWPQGIAAMEHATQCVGQGRSAIPDDHGEFFLAPLAGALALYEPVVDAETMARWRRRLSVPIERVIEGQTAKINNWRTYAMKGQWARYEAGLIAHEAAVAFIEDAWLKRSQRERIVNDLWNLYQDWNGHPQSHAVEAVGRGNLLALVAAGYDGPSAGEIRSAVLRGTQTTLWLQDPTGQCPPNGRTDNHVFNDLLYALCFETAAAMAADTDAPRYRRAADLSLHSMDRWRRFDMPWTGAYSITKNHFDPARRIGYQPASQMSNYSGAVLYHLAELYRASSRDWEIAASAPSEDGGFTLETDPMFGSAFANAGGMQVVANLVGDSVPKYGDYWTPLGIVRFARKGWDSRLGPSDGARAAEEGEALTFAPTWKRRGEWIRLADMAADYRGTFTEHEATEQRVKCSILYAPVTGVGGSLFRMNLDIRPNGVLVELSSPNDIEFGITIPLLENDGRNLELLHRDRAAGTRYADGGDEQWFIGIDDDQTWTDDGASIQSTYGRLKPLRVTGDSSSIRIFVYPRKPGEESVDALRDKVQRRIGR